MEYYNNLAILGGINVIAVTGMILLVGFTGMFSLGQAGFMAIGAYGAAILYLKLGVPFLLSILLGGLIAVFFSILIGYPTIKNRLVGDYFGIVTLGFGEAVRIAISNEYTYLNGALGLLGIPKKTTILVVAAFVVVFVWLMRNFIKSQYGKNCVAIREEEVASEIIGIKVIQTKMIALMISAFYAGIAGGLYAFYMTALYPQAFGAAKSNDVVAAVVFGGMGSIAGPVITGFLLTLLPEVLRFFATWRLVIYGITFVIVMLFRPEGLFGYREFSFKGIYHGLAKLTGLIKRKRGDPNASER